MWRRVDGRAAKASIRLATASIIAPTLIQLGETKGAARQLEGRRCRCGWGGADPSTPTLVKPGEMKGGDAST